MTGMAPDCKPVQKGTLSLAARILVVWVDPAAMVRKGGPGTPEEMDTTSGAVMRRSLTVGAGAAALALLGMLTAPPRAEAQGTTFVGPGGPVTLTPGARGTYSYSSSYVAPGGSVVSGGGGVAPYSYYVAVPFGMPARLYVGYGANDFPFYGQPYGHSYDRWTWPYLNSSVDARLVRYYYPPVP
jgi:hypothetical protein